MSLDQRNLLIVFLSLTMVLLVMEEMGIDKDILTHSRYLVVIMLSIATYSKRGRSHEQKILFLAFPLMILGDFFLVLSYSINGFPGELRYIGFIPFSAAYLLIARIYIRGFRWKKWLLLPTIVYGLLLVVIGIIIIPYLNGVQRLLGSMVALSLTMMAWAGASAIWNGYYGSRTALMMAFSGLLMVICDYGVALDLFYPGIGAIRSALAVNLVWLTYIPGWTILALVVVERYMNGRVYDQ